MKYIDGLTYKGRQRENRKERTPKTEWHKWFAWYPVTIGETDDGNRKVNVWWQYVYRKGTFIVGFDYGGWWAWEYKETLGAVTK